MTIRNWFSPEGAAFLNVQTGDGRMLGEIRWDAAADDHGPLRVVWEDVGFHDGAVEIGRTLGLDLTDDALFPTGWMSDDTADGAEVMRRHDADPPHPLTVSVDLDDVDLEVFGPAEEPLDDDGEPMLASSFPYAEMRQTARGLAVRIPGARAALTAAGLTAVVAAAGEGLPEDAELWFTEESGEIIFRISGRYRGLTLVDIPAFDRARIELAPADDMPDTDDEDDAPGDMAAVTAAVVGELDLPIAERDAEWDGSAAMDRVFELCTDGDTVDEACVARAFLWRDDDADPQTQAAYSLGFADVINDQLQIVPAGVFATAGGRGVDALEGISDEDRDRIKARICSLYDAMRDHFEDDEIVCPFEEDDGDEESGDAETAASASKNGCGCGGTCGGCGTHGGPDGLKVSTKLTDRSRPAATVAASGSGVPVHPPKTWFDNPKFGPGDVVKLEDPQTGRTLSGVPMHYGDDGRVWGHIALWGQCHTGSPQGQCVLAPRSQSGYQWFHHGQVKTAEGDLLPVGSLTLGGGHADVKLSYRAALEHYDNVATLAAQIRAGEDDYGIWVAGALMPDVAADEVKMRKLRGSSPSGDWRWIGGTHELSIAHCVNGPGFPVPRAKVAAGGEILAMVAAGAREVSLLADEQDAATVELSLDTEAVKKLMEQAVEVGIEGYIARQKLEADGDRARQALRDRARDRAAARIRG